MKRKTGEPPGGSQTQGSLRPPPPAYSRWWAGRCSKYKSFLQIQKFTNILGKPFYKRSAVQMEFCQIAFQPPHPQANGRFVGTIFAENR